MKIAIIGSRTITNYNLESIVSDEVTEIVSGSAKGADTLAREYAEKHGLKYTEFLPDYSRYGKAAPIVRNKQIADYSDKVIALWNGKSKGTKSVIDYCRKENIEIEIKVIE